MAVAIRLSRVGRRKSPFYRIVVADSRKPRDGRFIEIIGHYQPLTADTKLEIQEDRAVHWLHVGAQPSDTVRSLMRKQGIMKRWHEEKLATRKARKGGASPEPAAPEATPEAAPEAAPEAPAEQ